MNHICDLAEPHLPTDLKADGWKEDADVVERTLTQIIRRERSADVAAAWVLATQLRHNMKEIKKETLISFVPAQSEIQWNKAAWNECSIHSTRQPDFIRKKEAEPPLLSGLR